MTMWETAVKKHEDKIYQNGMLFEKQQILIEQASIKFGPSVSTARKVKSVKNADKLDNALRKILSAKNREEVLKCLD